VKNKSLGLEFDLEFLHRSLQKNYPILEFLLILLYHTGKHEEHTASRSNLVNRPYLVQQLNKGIVNNRRLTLISAPAWCRNLFSGPAKQLYQAMSGFHLHWATGKELQ